MYNLLLYLNYSSDIYPPFGISHILKVPIYPKDLYDETQGGWAYKAVDYIVYPLGNIVIDLLDLFKDHEVHIKLYDYY